MLPQTFVSSKGNAWLSYTVTGLHQNKWVDDHSGETQKGFTVQFTIYQSRGYDSLIVKFWYWLLMLTIMHNYFIVAYYLMI